MDRRKLLKALGLGALSASTTIKELIASSPEATEFVEDIDRQLGIEPEPKPTAAIPEFWAKENLKSLEAAARGRDWSDELTDYMPFNSGDVCVMDGDQLKVTHTHSFGKHPEDCQCGGRNETSKSRVRHWDVLCSLTLCGGCVEGLVVKTTLGKRLAREDEVHLDYDSRPNMTPEIWLDAHGDTIMMQDRIAEYLPEAVQKLANKIDEEIMGMVKDQLL